MAADVFAGGVSEFEGAAVVGAGFVGSLPGVVEGDGDIGHGLAGRGAECAADDVAGIQVGLLELVGAGEELERFGGLFAVVVLQGGAGLIDAWQE